MNGGRSVTGLLSRGGFVVDMYWEKEAQLTNATVTSRPGNTAWMTVGPGIIGGGGFVQLLNTTRDQQYVVKRSK